MPDPSIVETISADRSCPTVRILDFAYPYTHVKPFPLDSEYAEAVDDGFSEIFSLAADALR